MSAPRRTAKQRRHEARMYEIGWALALGKPVNEADRAAYTADTQAVLDRMLAETPPISALFKGCS